jgi:hypothetical protein
MRNGAEASVPTKQIFIEVVPGVGIGDEQVNVDWNTSFTTLQEIAMVLQNAFGAIMQEIQKQVVMRGNQVVRPDFARPRG